MGGGLARRPVVRASTPIWCDGHAHILRQKVPTPPSTHESGRFLAPGSCPRSVGSGTFPKFPPPGQRYASFGTRLRRTRASSRGPQRPRRFGPAAADGEGVCALNAGGPSVWPACRVSRVTSELRNWAGTYTYTAGGVVNARTVDDVRRAVLGGGRVRAVGTRHSFNDLADTTGTLISVSGTDGLTMSRVSSCWQQGDRRLNASRSAA